MRAALWMTAASLGSVLAIAAAAGRRNLVEILLGMAAPLAATTVSWVVTERTYRHAPERLTAAMTAGFAVKVVFFGAYVVLMLAVLRLRPTPFVASFTGYFIALYLAEALLMRRMFGQHKGH